MTQLFQRFWLRAVALLVCIAAPQLMLQAGDDPYFVTYSHRMEEPDNLEIGLRQATGAPKKGNPFLSTLLELEYGVRTWWTAELYLAGQRTRGESAIFTGYRLENRFRPLAGEHWINPVLYVEFADVNGADKSLKEIVGHDSLADQLEPNGEARRERKREIETKLILSSNVKAWNISENLIAEKNLANEPWEFGYAVGISRPLATAAGPAPCRLCRENFRAGVEIYGGLGTRHEFGLRDTSRYLGPALAWQLPGGAGFMVSPSFGLNSRSHRVLLRFAVTYEVSGAGRAIKRSLRWRP